MSYRQFFALVTMLVISEASASAQTAILQKDPNQTILKTALLAPLASSSFAPTSFGGTFNGSPVTIGLGWVSLDNPTGPVMMGLETGSVIVLGTPQGIANGNYSVVVTVPWSNSAATVQLVRGATEVGQCAVQQQLSYAAGAPIQRCDTGPFAVTEGNLNLVIRIKNPNPTCVTCVWSQQLSVSQVAINLFR